MSMAAVAPEYEDPQASLFEMPDVSAGYFSVKTGKAQELPEGEEFSLKIGQIRRFHGVGEVLAFGWRDGKLTWEITATEVSLG